MFPSLTPMPLLARLEATADGATPSRLKHTVGTRREANRGSWMPYKVIPFSFDKALSSSVDSSAS